MSFQIVCDSGEFDDIDGYRQILLVEEDLQLAEAIQTAFSKIGLSAEHFLDMEAGLVYWKEHPEVFAIIDENQLWLEGKFVPEQIPKPYEGILNPYMILTDCPDYHKASHYIQTGALGYLVKGSGVAAFIPELVGQQIQRIQAQRELQKSQRALLDNQVELKRITENLEDILVKVDPKFKCTFVSSALKKVLQIPTAAFLDKSLLTFVHDNDKPQVQEALQQVLSGKANGKYEFRMRRLSGQYIWIEALCAPVRNESEAIEGMILTLRDITQRKWMDRQLDDERNFINSILETIDSQIAVLTLGGEIIRYNRAIEKLTGYSADAIIGESFWRLIASEGDRQNFILRFNALRSGELVSPFECSIRTMEGETKILRISLSKIELGQGGEHYIVCAGMDITGIKKIEEEIRYMSFHDQLTGLYNRFYYEEELNRLDNSRKLPLSIIVGDVNGLKLINDGFGHDEGDRLICQAADILKSACRAEDVVARIGGDEFSILLPDTHEEAAQALIERIRERCKDAESTWIHLSIALGLSTKHHPEEDIRTVFRRADDQMYQEKLLRGRSYRSAMVDSLEYRLRIRNKYASEHSERVQQLICQLGRRMGLESEQLKELETLARLHDIGEIMVPEEILSKPSALNESEWNLIKKHAETGFRIVSVIPELSNLAESVLHHHERMDGSGYPHGITGDVIPLYAKILSVVDAFEAMTSPREYRSTMSVDEALQELRVCAGTQFDKDIVGTFIEMVLADPKLLS